MTNRLIVEGYDNRGDRKVPFGFVYFNDETRVGYAPGAVTEPIPGFPGLFPGNWGGNTERHYRLATEFLVALGVNLNPQPSKEAVA